MRGKKCIHKWQLARQDLDVDHNVRLAWICIECHKVKGKDVIHP